MTRSRHPNSAPYELDEPFRSLADIAPMMICASGVDRKAMFFNQAWLNFTGRSKEQELGNGWLEGVHREDLDRCLADYNACFDTLRQCHLEYRLRRADGEYRSIAHSGIPCFAPDGAFSGYIASCLDITELRRSQEAAFDRQKLESLRVLTGGIAHDFNNLMGGILAEAELAETEPSERESMLEGIQRIRGLAARAAEIVRELMIYSGQEKATLESVDMSRLVADMLQLLKVSISKRACVTTDLADDLPRVLGNAAQIRQVVMNLVINASEAVADNGMIHVATARVTQTESADLTSDRPPAGDCVRLTIADTGCGMTEEARSRIFDPFFTTKPSGHGLGLAVVHGIVRSHGGAINVVSSLGQGARFEVLFPCAKELGGHSRSVMLFAGDEGIAPATGGAVLVVEHVEALRIAVGKALLRRGFTVFSAADGQTALDALRANISDIGAIVLEPVLPDGSGYELLREARSMKPAIRAIVTSAWRSERGRDPAGTLKGVICLRKPYRISELARILEDLIPTPGGAGPRAEVAKTEGDPKFSAQ